MSRREPLKLPYKLTKELGIPESSNKRRKLYHQASRKEVRKNDRARKKANQHSKPAWRTQRSDSRPSDPEDESDEEVWNGLGSEAESASDDGTSNTQDGTDVPTPKARVTVDETKASRHIPRGIQQKLDEDDEEIAALEAKLGLKRTSKLPQAFQDEGLADLLEGLDGRAGDAKSGQGDEDVEAKEWLENKRKTARSQIKDVTSSRQDQPAKSHRHDIDPEDREDDPQLDSASSGSVLGGAQEDELPVKPVRENPYVAPTSHVAGSTSKYVPPSRRGLESTDGDVETQLRRQVKGLVNRLTEANIPSIIGSIEELYQKNARGVLTNILIDLTLAAIVEPTSHPDTHLILHGGFLAALYRVIGTDFGAHAVQRIITLYNDHYASVAKSPEPSKAGKEALNLAGLLSILYSFHVISSNLVCDLIRLLVQSISELNTELLLRILRLSGSQLRHDDPAALREVAALLRPAVDAVGEDKLPARTRFMIETINEMKHARPKNNAVAASVVADHLSRMKKALGQLSSRGLKATEPLRLGLQDLDNADTKGKWWLVGASWKSPSEVVEMDEQDASGLHVRSIDTGEDPGAPDLLTLAREQRMNTDIRRAIFVAIMSASDCQDAYQRITKLHLKRAQEIEIPKVILHCAGSEKNYNPYYTLIARRLCGDRKSKMAFQFGLWDFFKRLGNDPDDEDSSAEDEDQEPVSTRQIVNLAKLYGSLIADAALSLDSLKVLNLLSLKPNTSTFVEVMLITVFVESQRQAVGARDEAIISRIVSQIKSTSPLAKGLELFLKRVISKTEIAGSKHDTATVKWACKVSCKLLQARAMEEVSDDM